MPDSQPMINDVRLRAEWWTRRGHSIFNEIEFNFQIRATTTVELCLDHYRAISARNERKNSQHAALRRYGNSFFGEIGQTKSTGNTANTFRILSIIRTTDGMNNVFVCTEIEDKKKSQLKWSVAKWAMVEGDLHVICARLSMGLAGSVRNQWILSLGPYLLSICRCERLCSQLQLQNNRAI